MREERREEEVMRVNWRIGKKRRYYRVKWRIGERRGS